MYKCLPYFVPALLVLGWAVFGDTILHRWSAAAEQPVFAQAAPAPVVAKAEPEPELIGTAIINGIEIRFEAPRESAPAATARPVAATAPATQVDLWMNMRAAWAGLTSALLGPAAVLFAVMFFALGVAGWRRLANARA